MKVWFYKDVLPRSVGLDLVTYTGSLAEGTSRGSRVEERLLFFVRETETTHGRDQVDVGGG